MEDDLKTLEDDQSTMEANFKSVMAYPNSMVFVEIFFTF